MDILQSLLKNGLPPLPKEDRDGHEDRVAWQRAIFKGCNIAAQYLFYVVQK